jgi:hypothetical protein
VGGGGGGGGGGSSIFSLPGGFGGANVHCGPHTEPLGLLVFVPGSLVGVKDIGFVGRPEAETP